MYSDSIRFWLATLVGNVSDGFNVPPEVFNRIDGISGLSEFIVIRFEMIFGYSDIWFSGMVDDGEY